MFLSPRDVDKLLLHQAGVLAQKRLARGLRLNYPEAVALLATQLLELIRDGKSVAELMDVGRRVLGPTAASVARAVNRRILRPRSPWAASRHVASSISSRPSRSIRERLS